MLNGVESTPVQHGHRTRTNSLLSSATPRLMQHRSPSRSMDLNQLGGELAFAKTPRQDDRFYDRRPSVTESLTSEGATATPRLPPWQGSESNEGGRKRQTSSNLEVPTHPFHMPLTQRLDSASHSNLGYGTIDPRAWFEAPDHLPKDVSYTHDGHLNGATFEVLVEKMSPQDTLVDPTFWDTFFLTFRLFSTPDRLLSTVKQRYDLAPPPQMPSNPAMLKAWNERKIMPIRLRIVNMLKAWLELEWQSDTDRDVLKDVVYFVEERIRPALPVEANRLLELASKHESGIASPSVTGKVKDRSKAGMPISPLHGNAFIQGSTPLGLPPTPIMGKQLFGSLRNRSMHIHIIEFHALELARQLTLMESRLVCAISAADLVQCGKRKAVSLKAMSTLSNRITGWVAENILNEQDAKKRTGLLKFFIKLADVS